MVLIEKLLLAMVGHNLVKITRADLDKDAEEHEGNRQLVKELLKTGKLYVEITTTISQMRSRTNHDRLSESLIQAIDAEALTTYMEKLCEAEKEASQELLVLLKRCKDSGKILRVLGDVRFSSSPLTTQVIERALKESYAALGESIRNWIFRGDLIGTEAPEAPKDGSPGYFFIQDAGETFVFDPREKRRRRRIQQWNGEGAFDLKRFTVIMNRVPLESRFSFDWANKICYIGIVARYLLSHRIANHNEIQTNEATTIMLRTEESLPPPPPPPPPSEEHNAAKQAAEEDGIFTLAVERFKRRMEADDVESPDEKVEKRDSSPKNIPTPPNGKPECKRWTSFRSFTEILEHGFHVASAAFDCFDEVHINFLYELADQEIREHFWKKEFQSVTQLIRDTFFLGRGELFRTAMDVLDFEEACEMSGAVDVSKFVRWSPTRNSLSPQLNRIAFHGGTMMVDDATKTWSFVSRPSVSPSWFMYQDKIYISEGFVLKVQEITLQDTDQITLFIHSSAFPLVNPVQNGGSEGIYPSFSVQISKSKCVLYLDGLFVTEHALEYPDEANEKRTHRIPRLELRQFVVNNRDDDDDDGGLDSATKIQVLCNDVIVIDFEFEDPLVIPKWLDSHGRSYFGIMTADPGVVIKDFQVEALGSQRPFPKLIVQNSFDFFPVDLLEELNGAFVALFRLKRSHELLSQSWTCCKRDARGSRGATLLRFVMAKTVSSLLHYFQMDLVETGFGELRQQVMTNSAAGSSSNMLQQPVIHLEYLLSFTRLALERLVARMSLNNTILKTAMDNILELCDGFSARLLDARRLPNHDQNLMEEEDMIEAQLGSFHQAVKTFIVLLRRSSASASISAHAALDLAEAMDFSGFWRTHIPSSSLGDLAG